MAVVNDVRNRIITLLVSGRTESCRGGVVVIESVFRTADVAPEDGFDMWREQMANAMAPMNMSADQPEQFAAEMSLRMLGEVGVWPTSLESMSFVRTSQLIRQSDPDRYHLTLPLSGGIGISQRGQSGFHGPWEMYVVSTSDPFDCTNKEITAVGLDVPRRLLPLAGDKVRRLVTRRLSGREGPGALLAETLVRLGTESIGSFRPSDGPRLEPVVVDLLAATLAHHLDADGELPPETRTRSLALRIQSFIRHHLQDPELTPGTIAAAHHISLRHLHTVFRTLGHHTSPAAWIRQQRLEQARRFLIDPAHRTTPVHHIAVRCGFTDPAVFSRTFRNAFGLPPRDYRHQALSSEKTPTISKGSTVRQGDPT
ncbi:AraC family transcriptional regulator [Streptomyces sp. NBC_01498]|uniref:AraC family transcriptional regulator n=1 Tax=Streptomyces sp. NBC_01498 TaxID=2975870 RepID=UPI002E7BB2D1|nr:AraC family transcriptional regulator [Streptomyces sp. NBC_01498]WTL23495.1 AraC family transcriptional regulator [Streptomyces sp. NBC_01498]